MSVQCLVTKLQGAVSDESLPKIGELWLKTVNASVALQNFGQNIFNFLGSGSSPRITNDGEYVGALKAHITTINVYSKSFISLNVEDLQDCVLLKSLNVGMQTISGDFSKLPTSITFLMCGDTSSNPVSITKLCHLTNLVQLVCVQAGYKFRVSGSLEDFVAGQIANGRTSCDGLYLGLKAYPNMDIYPDITFNGSAITICSKVTWNYDGTDANITVTAVS